MGEVTPPFRWIAASDFHVVDQARAEDFQPFIEGQACAWFPSHRVANASWCTLGYLW